MKTSCFTLFLLLLNNAIGQDSRWCYGVENFINYSLGIPLEGSKNSSDFQGAETGSLSNTFGLVLKRKIGDKSSISTGLCFSYYGDKSRWIEADPNNIWPYPHQYRVRHGAIEIPFSLIYKVHSNWYVQIGVSGFYSAINRLNLFIDYPNTPQNNSEKITDKQLNCSINFGFGYEKAIGQRKLYLMPFSQLLLLPQSEYIALPLNPDLGPYHPARNYILTGLKFGFTF